MKKRIFECLLVSSEHAYHVEFSRIASRAGIIINLRACDCATVPTRSLISESPRLLRVLQYEAHARAVHTLQLHRQGCPQLRRK